METVTRERRDSLIAGFNREAMHLEMRDVYAAADHDGFRKRLAGEPFDPEHEADWWRAWREMMRLSGDGKIQGYELATDRGVIRRSVSAFEAAWDAAIQHSEYTPS